MDPYKAALFILILSTVQFTCGFVLAAALHVRIG